MEEETPKKTPEEIAAEQAQMHLYEFVKSDGWTEVKKIFIRKLAMINSISNIVEGATFEETVKQALLNKSVVEWVIALLQEIEGTVGDVEYVRQMNDKIREEGIFLHFQK